MLEQSDMAEEDVAHMAQNLKVFCVSSLDYQKTTLPDEDEPEVRIIVSPLLILAEL